MMQSKFSLSSLAQTLFPLYPFCRAENKNQLEIFQVEKRIFANVWVENKLTVKTATNIGINAMNAKEIPVVKSR